MTHQLEFDHFNRSAHDEIHHAQLSLTICCASTMYAVRFNLFLFHSPGKHCLSVWLAERSFGEDRFVVLAKHVPTVIRLYPLYNFASSMNKFTSTDKLPFRIFTRLNQYRL